VSYERKISTEEAKGKFVFILKNALKKFSQTNKSFTMQVDNKKYSTRIESVSCTCIGTLHEHYHMLVANIPELSNLKKGDIVTIKKLSEDIYSVSVKGKT
jgi:flagellar motor switch protein FliM